MAYINLKKVGLSSMLATTLLLNGGIGVVHADSKDNNVSKEVSKSSNNAVKLADEFYNKGDINILKNNGFKVLEQGEGYYTAVKDGVAVVITPNQAKEMGAKVNKKYLKEDIKTTDVQTNESKVSQDNTLLNGKDAGKDNEQEKEVSDVKERTIVEKELNWWAIAGIGLLSLLALGLLFVPTKKDKNGQAVKKPKVK